MRGHDVLRFPHAILVLQRPLTAFHSASISFLLFRCGTGNVCDSVHRAAQRLAGLGSGSGHLGGW